MTRYPFQPKPLLRIIRIGMQVTANSGFGNANQNSLPAYSINIVTDSSRSPRYADLFVCDTR